MDTVTLSDEVGAIDFWWHSIDLGNDLVTPGRRGLDSLEEDAAIMLPDDLSGKTVLDVGAWDGFFSFAAERRGARRVVAIDEPRLRHKPSGKESIELCVRALHSKVEVVWGDWMTMDPEPFDVVIFSGVLYHCRDMLRALERLRQLTSEVAVIESHCEDFGILSPMVRFYEEAELNGDPTNWWGPNQGAIEAMCRAAGFLHVARTDEGRPGTRAIFRAYSDIHAWYNA